MSKDRAALQPRKSPVQARSSATVEALHIAAVQVLMREGLGRCTTTRVAVRAGTSVGSLYQYYPNRDALLAAILKRHLDGIADACARVCREQQGRPVSDMASVLVRAFLAAKLRDPEESKALYAVAAERGGAELCAHAQARMAASITDMLASAVDVHFDDPAMTAMIALNAMIGPVRAVLEGMASAGTEDGLEAQLTLLLASFFQAHPRRMTAVSP
ncbi:MAG: TetR/AcrR family transcriptional regulator [Castellaniella sp.]|uniref:TetR/AcrR family transcriptional regulator n=1 Tax=Castellaniella sp. TaxID=1955812 RepID=UPI003C790178